MSLVSIVMPAFNCESTLGEAIESVRRQSFEDWELIVVDDASVDSTLVLAKEFAAKDKRITVLSNAVNSGGAVEPRNKAIALATGDFIALLDADDIWGENKLEKQLAYMQSTQLDLSGTWVEVCDEQGCVIGKRCPPEQVTFSSLLKRNVFACSSVMCVAELLKKNPFPNLGHEDYALWLLLLRDNAQAGILQESLTYYRKRRDSLSANKLKVVPFFWHIYRQQLKFSVFFSVFFTCRYLLLAAVRDLK
ncbi:glycosyltransferase family 2 protein [Gilvimarinus chinensis]|uniref:glycosyltransferase family 2 protein n=1 Tax=Gilvimarinus chinensis TaxID=396005 RepID=UPI000367729E|nr:glycosyltransferase family 2 protein [Gilvimarinus chinensis]